MIAGKSHNYSCTECLVMQACCALLSIDWTLVDIVLHLSTHSSGFGRIYNLDTKHRRPGGGRALGSTDLSILSSPVGALKSRVKIASPPAPLSAASGTSCTRKLSRVYRCNNEDCEHDCQCTFCLWLHVGPKHSNTKSFRTAPPCWVRPCRNGATEALLEEGALVPELQQQALTTPLQSMGAMAHCTWNHMSSSQSF